MENAQVLNIFDEDKAWLIRQPGMAPWEEGRGRLLDLLNDCLRRYSEEVREPPAGSDNDDRPAYLARLWRCLGYHWQDGAKASAGGRVEVGQVAERIQSGQGYRRGGRLGGNPLRDVVLAVAMVQKDQRAPRVFRDDYYAFAQGLAASLNPRLADEVDQWWSELLDHLAGYTKRRGTRPRGRLDKFFGRSALRNWLGTVVWNFLRRWRLPQGGHPAANDPPAPVAPPVGPESIRHFAALIRSALKTLPRRDRLMLALIYIDRLKKNQAAAILGVHPGQISRRLPKVLASLEASTTKLAAERLSEDACSGIFEDLREDPRAFAAALREALEETREDLS